MKPAQVPSTPSAPESITSSNNPGPGEARAAPGDKPLYDFYTHEDALSRPYVLPSQFLAGIRPEAGALPEAPLIVFINARSGGRAGPELALALSRALGRVQVFDLSHYKPDVVLTQLWENFKTAIAGGVPNAAQYQQRLRLLVAGGDGTIAWVLGTIKALKLQPAPPVAIMPLGTGNDLSRSFGWGPAYDDHWINGHKRLYQTLMRIQHAKVEDLDCWRLKMVFPRNELLNKLPHSLRVSQHSQHGAHDDATGSPVDARPVGAAGLFWNYVSVGLDARAAYNFHHLRETNPAAASNRMINQFWYSFFSCTSGWFCCAKSVSAKAQLQVQKPGSDDWINVVVPSNIKAIVILNLQSYAGGRNLWGPHSDWKDDTSPAARAGFREPSYNDGLLEVVGFGSGWHTAMVMGSNGNAMHAQRLTQASGVRLSLKAKYVRPDGRPSHCYLQIDGEPWMQDVPSSKDDQPIMIEITNHGVSKILHNHLGLKTVNPAALPISKPVTAANLPVQDEGGELQLPHFPHSALPSPHRHPHLTSTVGSMAGTAMDSEAVQVGSERASSIRSGNSWATSYGIPMRMEANGPVSPGPGNTETVVE